MRFSLPGIAEAVGAELRRLRQRAGLSQGDVARLTGTHRPIIGRIEHGRHCPTLAIAVLHAEVCGGGARDVLRVVDRVLGLAQPKRRRASVRAGIV
jgi:transcriptional regulator with XRE-family HTH domain